MNGKMSMILIGGAVGAALGATVTWAYVKAQEEKSLAGTGIAQPMKMEAGAGDFVKIGLAVFALMRQVTDLFKPV
jgi:hypothetical protein